MRNERMPLCTSQVVQEGHLINSSSPSLSDVLRAAATIAIDKHQAVLLVGQTALTDF